MGFLMNTLLVAAVFSSILTILILSLLMFIKSSRCYIQSLTNGLKNISVPVCIVNSHSNEIVDYNKHFYELIKGRVSDDDGENSEEASISLLSVFENFEDYLEIKRSSKRGNTACDKIVKINTLKGVRYVSVQPSYFKAGFKKNIVLFFNDVTEEAKSFKYLGVFTSIIENIRDGILISRKNENCKLPKIIYSNAKLTKITGYKREEILNKPINAIFELNVDDYVLDTIKEKVAAAEYSELKYKYTAKSGREYWLHMSIIPVTDYDIKQALKNTLNSSSNLVSYINKLDGTDIFIVLHQTNLENL